MLIVRLRLLLLHMIIMILMLSILLLRMLLLMLLVVKLLERCKLLGGGGWSLLLRAFTNLIHIMIGGITEVLYLLVIGLTRDAGSCSRSDSCSAVDHTNLLNSTHNPWYRCHYLLMLGIKLLLRPLLVVVRIDIAGV